MCLDQPQPAGGVHGRPSSCRTPIQVTVSDSSNRRKSSEDCSRSSRSSTSEDTEMLKAMLRVLNDAFFRGDRPHPDVDQVLLPESRRCATILPIPKGGDRTLCSNYRGIALMHSALKHLCSVLADRFQQVLHNDEVLIQQLAGFCKRESCMAQVCALYEVLQQRRYAGFESHVAFLHLRKAYDMVTHEGLMGRLEALGIGSHEKFYGFIRTLYQKSTMSVRLDLENGTDTFPLQHGVRQGGPLSPMLFNLFVDDLLTGCEQLGWTVPGQPPWEQGQGEIHGER